MTQNAIRDEIENFLSYLESKYQLFPYCCNVKKGGFVPGKDMIYYSGPYWDIHEKVTLIEAALTGKWLSAGEYVHTFEKMFSKKFNFEDTVMVNSGSSANLIMITSLKKYQQWEDGDEIILSPVGFPTTLAPIVQNQLKPIFIDISWDDLNFNIDLIEKKITQKSRAILISPVLGNPPDMDRLIELSTKTNIPLVLDNCDSLGSRWRGKYLSDYCITSSCSFYPAHHITTGQGGTVSSNNSDIIKLARSFSGWGGDCSCVGAANLLPNGSCGKRFSKWLKGYDGLVDHRYLFSNVGYNLRPIDIQGAIGIEQLKKFDEIHAKRRANKEIIKKAFNDFMPNVRILEEHKCAETSWFGVGVICNEQKDKEELVFYLEKNGIQTRNYFAGNLLLHPAYENLGCMEDYPNSNMVLPKMFFIGCSPTITGEMIEHIVNVIHEYTK
jgi:CDP-4-dehydro-6-deoxyglucose reductase, E1